MYNLLFTWQPTTINVTSTAALTGVANTGTVAHDKPNRCWDYPITGPGGFRLVHTRAWELLEVRAVTADVSIFVLPKGDLNVANAVEIATVPAGTQKSDFQLFSPKEIVVFKTTVAADFRLLVREYSNNIS